MLIVESDDFLLAHLPVVGLDTAVYIAERLAEKVRFTLHACAMDDKAMIIGSIYKARLMNKINNDEMLRLCSVVTRASMPDLKSLSGYLEENSNISIVA